MDITCERCRTEYEFDESRLGDAGVTVKCTTCGHVFKVKKKELVVTVPVKPDEMDGAPIPATAAAPRPGGTHASVPAPKRSGAGPARRRERLEPQPREDACRARIPRGRRVWGARGQFSERDADAYAIRMLRAWRRRDG